MKEIDQEKLKLAREKIKQRLILEKSNEKKKSDLTPSPRYDDIYKGMEWLNGGIDLEREGKDLGVFYNGGEFSFSITITSDDEDGYIARCNELNLYTCGKSLQDLCNMISNMIEGHIIALSKSEEIF